MSFVWYGIADLSVACFSQEISINNENNRTVKQNVGCPCVNVFTGRVIYNWFRLLCVEQTVRLMRFVSDGVKTEPTKVSSIYISQHFDVHVINLGKNGLLPTQTRQNVIKWRENAPVGNSSKCDRVPGIRRKIFSSFLWTSKLVLMNRSHTTSVTWTKMSELIQVDSL